ncbi:MAG TPA: DUF4230 domain-containing protein [Candidatus Dormibacteraeota bacterium]|nr:DUF4230 domain-containing protein [Candidatus Dormibacteraeota bacterium]
MGGRCERISALIFGLVHAEVVGQTDLRSWVLGTFLGTVLTVVLMGALVWLSSGLGLLHLIGVLRGGRPLINVDQPTVVRQIQQLQRLETVSYTMDKIISGEHANAYLPKFLAGDRVLLVAHGEVVCGNKSRTRAARRCLSTRAEGINSPARPGTLQHSHR